ncbi:ORF56 [callitrichine gammaherpesvirus 3]|uniref:ORF56 n=1 Tax=callitrichine gammaherpesvirus 3 TaxID=106331 RepID=Q993F3_9GAMA|nr:ORF56 [callitrichine gammaherpesvirus 3]AAK38265.1 ORF56 [callitrichine gammaherpesvirus 3]
MKVVSSAINKVRVHRQFLGLLPATARRLNITDKDKFVRDVRGLIDDHMSSSAIGATSIWKLVTDYLPNRSVYSDFLIQASSFNNAEVIGSPLFLFKQTDPYSAVDIIFTPLSLFLLFDGLCNDGVGHYAGTKRMASLMYDSQSSMMELVPNLETLVNSRSFHTFLTPVGPLVENIKSTFLNKITSVIYGPSVTKNPPMESVRIKFPAESFIDLDAWLGGICHTVSGPDSSEFGHCPHPSNARLLAAITYEQSGPKLMFFRSYRGLTQVMNALRLYYSPGIMHRYAVTANPDINGLIYGAFVSLGTVSASDIGRKDSLNYKGSSLSVVVFDNFIARSSDWTVII